MSGHVRAARLGASLIALALAACSSAEESGAADGASGASSGGAGGSGGASGAAGGAGAPAPGNDTDPDWPADEPLPPEIDFPPWVTMPEPRRIVVSWRTVSATTGTVAFGSSPSLGETAASSTSANLHHVDLGVLLPATAYWYEVRVDGTGAVRRGVFVTPGRSAFRFVHFGEFHAPGQSEHVAKFASHLRNFRPHLLVESGDMVDSGELLEDWRSYFRTAAPWISNLILLPAGSNHVDGPGGNANLKDLFVLPNNERWYATRYGPLLAFSLDSTTSLVNLDISTEQPAWLREQNALAHDGEDDPTFVIGAWHYPACSSLQKNRAGDRVWVQNSFIKTFKESGGVDLVLVGHDKYYERSEIVGGIPHVMTNVGLISPSEDVGNNHRDCTEILTIADTRSVGLVTVADGKLSLEAIDEVGMKLDELVLEK